MNSGVLRKLPVIPGAPANLVNVQSLPKPDLGKLHTPVIYIIGGPTDIAYENANGDFDEIKGVPVFRVDLDTGHNGTLWQPHGGRFADIASAWLQWRLNGDDDAAQQFAGDGCGLCRTSGLTVRTTEHDQPWRSSIRPTSGWKTGHAAGKEGCRWAGLRSLAILWALAVAGSSALAHAQPGEAAGGPVGILENPCPPPLQPPAQLEALQKAGPRAVFESRDPQVTAFLREEDRRRGLDRAGLCRYRSANVEMAGKTPAPAVVFMRGDSITDFWPGLDAAFFTDNGFTGRGIGAQVTSQGLLRFEQDVVEEACTRRSSTSSTARTTSPVSRATTTYERIQNNLTAMVQLARANHIAVVIGTILPISHLPGGPDDPALTPKIVAMNAWIREFGKRENVAVADYYPALSDAAGHFRAWS